MVMVEKYITECLLVNLSAGIFCVDSFGPLIQSLNVLLPYFTFILLTQEREENSHSL